MDKILAGLNAVDWPSYEHAYGTAENTPDLLRAALAGRDDAVFELLASLFHQGGGVYPAAVPAMPFLIQLACEPTVPDRLAVLELLGLFTNLLSTLEAKGRTDSDALALRTVVEKALPQLLALLEDPNPEVRREATEIVAACHFQTDLIGRALSDRFARESDEGLRVDAVIGFWRLAAWMSHAERAEFGAWAATITEPFAALAALAASEKLLPGSVPAPRVFEVLESPDLPAHLYVPAASRASDLVRWADGHFAIPALRRQLAHWALEPRHAGESGLMHVGDLLLHSRQATAELVPGIAALLDHELADVRRGAAHLLAATARTSVGFGEQRRLVLAPFIDRIAAALDDPDDGVVTRAVWALARVGDARAAPYLAAEIDGKSERFEGSAHYGRLYFPLDDTPDLDFLLPSSRAHTTAPPEPSALRAMVTSPDRMLNNGGWRGIAEDDEAVELALAALSPESPSATALPR